MDQEDPKKKREFYKNPWFWIIVVVVIFIAISAANNSGSGGANPISTTNSSASICDTDPQTIKKEAFVPDYKQLVKDPSASQGTMATFTGQILQIQQSGNEGIIRLSVTKESYGWSPSDIVYVTYHQATNAVEGDVVSVTGMLTGTETYTSQANFQITVPSIDVCTVDTKPAAATQSAASKPQATAPVANTPVAQSSQQTYTTPSDAIANNAGNVVTPSPASPASWHTVQTFSGTDNTNTNLFTIQGSQWQIQWSATADASDSFCQQNGCPFNVQLYQPGSDLQQDYLQGNVYTTKSGSGYFYSPGQYYLKINGYKITNWTATVQDYY